MRHILFIALILIACQGPAQSLPTKPLALVGAKIYPSPTAPPIEQGTVLIRDGKIIAVGGHDLKIPPGTQVLDCTGMVLLAGFWNSHVHFIEPKWDHAASLPAQQLTAQLQEMLTRYGYTHVFELASISLQNALDLRARITSGEVAGPAISIATPFVPPHGNPFYIAPLRLPELGDPATVADFVSRKIDSGADGIKLWSSSPVTNGVVNMPLPLISAATATAHRLGKPVIAHESSDSGLLLAMMGGVDILAHTEPMDNATWTSGRVDSLIAHHMALIPTLKLWLVEFKRQGLAMDNKIVVSAMATALQQVRAFSHAGGEILFGTDVGYVPDYSPEDEYRLLGEAGMTFEAILTSLTTAPAHRFGKDKVTGRIAAGLDADLVLLSADPKTDPRAFAKVVYTFRQGKIIFH